MLQLRDWNVELSQRWMLQENWEPGGEVVKEEALGSIQGWPKTAWGLWWGLWKCVCSWCLRGLEGVCLGVLEVCLVALPVSLWTIRKVSCLMEKHIKLMKGLDWFWASSVSHPLIIAAPKGSSSIKRIPQRRVQTHLFASQYFHSIFYFFLSSIYSFESIIYNVELTDLEFQFHFHLSICNIMHAVQIFAPQYFYCIQFTIYNMQSSYLLPNFCTPYLQNLLVFTICNSGCAIRMFQKNTIRENQKYNPPRISQGVSLKGSKRISDSDKF